MNQIAKSPAEEKIKLFMELFHGRDDVYAHRWYNRKTQKSGYAPACRNEWAWGVCDKKKVRCADCPKQEHTITRRDFPLTVSLTLADQLYVEKAGILQAALNQIKRLAAFRNPDFYKAQAMRLPIYDKPRIIDCGAETERYLALPRGCLAELNAMLVENGIPLRQKIFFFVRTFANSSLNADSVICLFILLFYHV